MFAFPGNRNRPKINQDYKNITQDNDNKVSGIAVSSKSPDPGYGYHGGSRNFLWT